ncbi:DnaJ domain-containing protein [Pilaira anomala]|nr:DnaJ domain-containing protein [Pilaira anomala]
MLLKRSFHSTIVGRKRYYDILQLKHNADKKTIKTNYYRLSKKYHPDLNPNNKQAHAMFLDVNEAYSVLGNEASKRKYDYDNSDSGGSSRNNVANYSRSGGSGGNTQAWHFRNRKAPRSTGSTSAREQAEKMKKDKAEGKFDHSEHLNKHYEAEEHRRRHRVEKATERRRAAGDETTPGKVAPGMENLWGRFWRLGAVLTAIAYVAQKIN